MTSEGGSGDQERGGVIIKHVRGLVSRITGVTRTLCLSGLAGIETLLPSQWQRVMAEYEQKLAPSEPFWRLLNYEAQAGRAGAGGSQGAAGGGPTGSVPPPPSGPSSSPTSGHGSSQSTCSSTAGGSGSSGAATSEGTHAAVLDRSIKIFERSSHQGGYVARGRRHRVCDGRRRPGGRQFWFETNLLIGARLPLLPNPMTRGRALRVWPLAVPARGGAAPALAVPGRGQADGPPL